jgi:hypothetical protein
MQARREQGVGGASVQGVRWWLNSRIRRAIFSRIDEPRGATTPSCGAVTAGSGFGGGLQGVFELVQGAQVLFRTHPAGLSL